MNRAVLVTTVLLAAPLYAQHTSRPPAHPLDTSWIKTYADKIDLFDSDPRYSPLLKAAFPQRQWFWFDHNRLLTIPGLAETFLGLRHFTTYSGRYVTRAGCVPHDCTDNGLLWIDTDPAEDPGATRLILAVDPLISGGPTSHLWLFTSSNHFDWQKPSADFRTALTHWLTPIGTGQFGSHPILITIVPPNGRQYDLAPSFLLLAEIQKGAAQ